MKNPRAFAWFPVLAAIAVVFGVSGGSYWYVNQPTADPLAWWKEEQAKQQTSSGTTTDPYGHWPTYTDTEIGISFKYPPGSVLKSESYVLTGTDGIGKTARINKIHDGSGSENLVQAYSRDYNVNGMGGGPIEWEMWSACASTAIKCEHVTVEGRKGILVYRGGSPIDGGGRFIQRNLYIQTSDKPYEGLEYTIMLPSTACDPALSDVKCPKDYASLMKKKIETSDFTAEEREMIGRQDAFLSTLKFLPQKNDVSPATILRNLTGPTSFGAAPLSGAAPLKVNFAAYFPDTAESLMNKATYTVDFGDGTTGLLSKHSCEGGGCFELTGNHTYASSGAYMVRLLETYNGATSVVETKTVTVAATQ